MKLVFSSTLASVGTPSFYVDASSCSHGDLGQISSNDVLILISNSGESSELKNIIQYANRNKNITLIGIVSKKNSFILELVLGVFLIPYIFLSNIDLNYKIILSVLYLLLLAFEIMNTAIEKLCDKVTTDINPEIKKIKDLSSAAVFVVLLILIITFLASF